MPQDPDPSEQIPDQRTSGWRAIFSLAPVYQAAQRLIGADSLRQVLVNEILRPTDQDRLLDIGCGTADILDYLPNLDYIGFDPSEPYVNAAQARFGHRGTFTTAAAEHFSAEGADRTIAIAIGVLHHMNDEAVRELFDLAYQSLVPGGRLVTIDPALVDGQHRVARLLVSRDRGQHVRTPDQLEKLVSLRFPAAEVTVRHDLLRTPYTHAIIEARRPA